MNSYRLDTTKLDELIRGLPARIDDFLDNTSNEIVTDIKESFGESPSQAGEPPGVITGELKESVEAVKVSDMSYQVLVGAEHGLYQEFGTETISPRPFMTPIFHTWEDKFGTEAANAGIIT